MICKGIVKKDYKTKNLVKRLAFGDIALIKHRDIDEVAALSLIDRRPRLILNAEKSISGKYPNRGPHILVNSGIDIIDLENENIFEKIEDGIDLKIIENRIYCDDKLIGRGTLLSKDYINDQIELSKLNIESELDNFIENTLDYAKREKSMILGRINLPDIAIDMNNKHVLVVVRGKDYKEDLAAIRTYIQEMKPILIGVDGGGDALLEFGYIPDIVIGDMDSVSDKCLRKCKEIIVHAYDNGFAPGLNRVKGLELNHTTFPSHGTSEDIAMLLAYEKGADFIVAVGTHTNMIDFLEKGRKGMASTFLVRLKVGSKLIDAKGVNKLYKERIKPIYMVSVLLSSLIPIFVACLYSPLSKHLIRLIQIKLKLALRMKGLLW